MKITIDVADRKEAEQIRRGLADPQTRAVVRLMGILLPLKSKEVQVKVLRTVQCVLAAEDQAAEDRKLEVAGWHR